jgi:Common central domain of tyrosinase
MRYRKNIDCLREEELHTLRETLVTMYGLPASDPNSFSKQASFHGGPPTSYCQHGSPGFFTWHRAEAKAFEDALRAVGCEVALPYWDWSSGPSTGVPEACRHPTYEDRDGNTVTNPLYSGPRAAEGQTVRSAGIDSTAFDELAASAQAAMTSTSFSSFQNLINGVHGSVHVRVGGDMGAVPTASYDPIFYLHHANIDRLWARWQITHPALLPASEAANPLPPFTRPFTTQWQTGSDVVSTDAMGYRYLSFCLFVPPIRIWELAVIPWPVSVRDQLSSARLVFKSEEMMPSAVEIRAFVNQPRAAAGTKTIGNDAFAGAVGFIGHAGEVSSEEIEAEHCEECARLGHTDEHDHHHDHGGHAREHSNRPDHHEPGVERERFDVELDVTKALRRLDDAEEFTLKLVAVDADGDEVKDNVRIDEIELFVE